MQKNPTKRAEGWVAVLKAKDFTLKTKYVCNASEIMYLSFFTTFWIARCIGLAYTLLLPDRLIFNKDYKLKSLGVFSVWACVI